MKLKLTIIGLATLFVLLATLSNGVVVDDAQQQVVEESKNTELSSHKLFNFLKFKQMFNKRYSSLLEEMARQKLFFARAFKAFLSFVGYKNKKATSYLGINDMSDWTRDELRAIETRKQTITDDENDVDTLNRAQHHYEEEAADLADVEAKFREILEREGDNPAYETIAKELRESNIKIKSKRDVNQRSITLDNLFEEPEVEELSEKVVDTVPSTNDQYEAPELSSFGSDEDNKPEPMSDWQSQIIKNIPGAEIVGTILSGASDYFFGPSKPVEIIPDLSLPDQVFVDHRQDRCLLPVKHQGACGSCFIMSSTSLYEWRHCKETGNLVSFSEQYAIDCGNIGGCSGGQEVDVGRFFGIYGIELSKNYPYRGRVDTCPYEKYTPSTRMGYLKVVEPKLTTIYYSEFEKYIELTPILLGFGVSDSFHAYKGGVDLGLDCDKNRGHSMLVIGSGRENGIEYWLVRNSYGPHWGDRGHYKIAKQAMNCFLDRGLGWVLDHRRQVFGSVNAQNDGQAVKSHLRDYTKNHPINLSDWYRNRVTVDTSIATPSPF